MQPLTGISMPYDASWLALKYKIDSALKENCWRFSFEQNKTFLSCSVRVGTSIRRIISKTEVGFV